MDSCSSAKDAWKRRSRCCAAPLAAALDRHGPENYNVAYARVSLGLLLHDEGRLKEAETEYRQALAVYDRSLPPDHEYRASAEMYLARLLVDEGKPAEALPLSAQSFENLGGHRAAIEPFRRASPRHSRLCAGSPGPLPGKRPTN